MPYSSYSAFSTQNELVSLKGPGVWHSICPAHLQDPKWWFSEVTYILGLFSFSKFLYGIFQKVARAHCILTSVNLALSLWWLKVNTLKTSDSEKSRTPKVSWPFCSTFTLSEGVLNVQFWGCVPSKPCCSHLGLCVAADTWARQLWNTVQTDTLCLEKTNHPSQRKKRIRSVNQCASKN